MSPKNTFALALTAIAGLLVVSSCSDEDTYVQNVLPEGAEIVLVALNEAHNGDLGGLAGADALCASQAKAVSRKETYRAFLSVQGVHAKEMISVTMADTAPVVNARGEELAPSWNHLMDTSRWSTSAQLYSFDGKPVNTSSGAVPNWEDGDGWHGTAPGGFAHPDANCRNWTSSKPQDVGANTELDLRYLLRQEIHPCSSTLAVVCVGVAQLPSYGACTTPGAPCTTSDPCAVEPICGADKKCRPRRVQTCSDPLACTADTCDGKGGCTFDLKTGWCSIGGKCYQDGDKDPSGCQACDSKTKSDDWSPATTACMKNGKCYQKGDPDDTGCNECDPGKGNEGWVPRTGAICTIDGKCYGTGDKHPQGCAECDPAASAITWTPKGNDCFIDGACHTSGAKDPTGCNACAPATSKTSWSPISGTICKIDGKCYAKGDKHPQGCAECNPSVSALSWTLTSNDCLIGGACHAAGATDPTGCNACDPTVSKTSWSPISGTICKIDGKCYAKSAKHPQGCAECDPTKTSTAWTIVSNDCLIDGDCHAPGTPQPTGGCGECDPAKTKTAWSPAAGCFDIVLVALNEAHTGKLGGIAGADALCAAQAKTAGLSGTFKAYLSSSTKNVKDLITGKAVNYPVTNSKQELLFPSWSSIFTTYSWASGRFLYAFSGMKVDENQGAAPDWYDARGWTGSVQAGTAVAGKTCLDWTSEAATDIGEGGELDSRRLHSAPQVCSTTLAVVCVKTAL